MRPVIVPLTGRACALDSCSIQEVRTGIERISVICVVQAHDKTSSVDDAFTFVVEVVPCQHLRWGHHWSVTMVSNVAARAASQRLALALTLARVPNPVTLYCWATVANTSMKNQTSRAIKTRRTMI